MDDKETDNLSNSTETRRRKRWYRPLLIVFTALLVALSSVTTVDRAAQEDYESLFHRALITFALARTLNGVISVVQGTELALQPAGVGVTLTPGEVLDPINDLVERFSWIMLGATVSLGIQQVLLDIGQWWGTRLIVALLAVGWLALRLWRGGNEALEQTVLRALAIVLFVRFAVPLALIANEAVYEQFLESRYLKSTQVIESAGSEIQQANESAAELPEEGESGLFDSWGRAIDSTRESLSVKERVAVIKARATEVVEHVIQLSVVFILQTGILPLAFLWLLVHLAKRVFGFYGPSRRN